MYYVHNVPGRLRIKIPVVRKNPEAAREVAGLLDGLAGVGSYTVNSLTGSIVIHYNSSLVQGREILKHLAKYGYFDESKAVDNQQYIQRAASRAGGAISKAVFGFTMDKALEGTGLSFLTALI